MYDLCSGAFFADWLFCIVKILTLDMLSNCSQILYTLSDY